MKLANPLYYPLAMLVGSIALVVGVRAIKVPGVIMVPVAVAIATAGAGWRKSQEPQILDLDNPELEADLQGAHQQAVLVAQKAAELRLEAARLLTSSAQMELLGAVQYACDRASELPNKVEQVTKRMHGSDSLLSADVLQQQLAGVQAKLRSSSGVAHEQLSKLADSLKRNIQLAREGQDARQAQVASLSTLIYDSAGVLQEMQNRLRSLDLNNTEQTVELRSLSDELSVFQENVDFLIGK